MKVLAVQPNTATAPIKIKQSKSVSASSRYVSYTNEDLPSADSCGMSLVFKAKAGPFVGENLKRLLGEIEVTKQSIKLLEGSVTTKTQDVIDAENSVSKYEYWENNKDRIYKEAQEKAENAKQKALDSVNWWKRKFGSYGSNAYTKTMQEEYWNNSHYCSMTDSEYQKARGIVLAYNQTRQVSEENRMQKLEILRQKLKAQEESVNLLSVRDAVNEAMNNNGGINESIAGYEELKNEIKRTFVNPLIDSTKAKNNNVHVPSAVMLYGATGCGKTSILNAIRAQVKDYARVVDISADDKKHLIDQLNRELKAAREHYLETSANNTHGERTIILLNEAEAYFATNPTDIETSGLLFNKSDIRKMEEYNEQFDCTNNVVMLKSFLDYISKIPDDTTPNGCAATIFITSNYPHLMHRDLLSRDGEFGKMLSYAVRPAANEDLRAVIKYYFTKFSELIENMKYFAKQPDSDSLVDSLANISDKGKAVLKRKINDKTIENMNIDPTMSGFKNFDRFIQGNNPSNRRGAYSNARWENIIKKAFVNYLENPALPFEQHFLAEKNKKGVDIMPAAYRQFEDICDMVENPSKFKSNQTDTIAEDLKDLIAKYNDGEISDSEFSDMKIRINDIKERYNALKSQAELTPAEKKVKKQYAEFIELIQDIDIPD